MRPCRTCKTSTNLTVVSEVEMGGLYVMSHVVFLQGFKPTVGAFTAQGWTQAYHLGHE